MQIPKCSELRMSENLVAADMPIIEYQSKREKLQGGGLFEPIATKTFV